MGRGLLPPGRRYLAAALLALLAAPGLGLPVAPRHDLSVMERRTLAAPPAAPATLAQAAAWPRAADAWLRDHFAGREALVKADLSLQARAGLRPPGGVGVIPGRGDWLLLQQGLLGAAGAELDRPAAARYAAFACGLARDARARGAAFLFAPAPGPVEAYPEALPDWLAPTSPTQPELVLAAARACGAPVLDLRPAMIAAKGLGPAYQRHDSHWTNLGALAAFNGVAQALGQPWAIAPQAMGWRPAPARDQDLARLSGRLDLAPELIPEPPQGRDGRPETGGLADIPHGIFPPAFRVEGRSPRPVVLIVGDSYTSDFMPQYFRKAGVTLAWTHQADCRFDRSILARVRPDIVVLMPASRQEACR